MFKYTVIFEKKYLKKLYKDTDDMMIKSEDGFKIGGYLSKIIYFMNKSSCSTYNVL